MKKREGLPVTAGIRQALDAVASAERVYAPGRDSASVIELPKLRLADAVLAAIRAESMARLAKLPKKARPVAVIPFGLQQKRAVRS